MNLEQTQFPFQEKSNPKSYGLLMTILSSIAFIGMCIFINERFSFDKKPDNEG
jgi:hypothetical protein